MPGDLSVGGKEFQVLIARMKKERWQVVVFAFCRTQGNLVATGGSGRFGFGNDFREDIMGHVDQAVHCFKKEHDIQILMPVR